MIRLRYPDSSRRMQILRLALPIILGMLSMNVMDIIDIMMIGRLGNAALAATGIASFLFFVCFAPMGGIAAAVQTMSARRLGENQLHRCGESLTIGISLTVFYGVIVMMIMGVLSPMILRFFSEDFRVLVLANDYFIWRLLGLLALGMLLCFRGFWKLSENWLLDLNYGLIFAYAQDWDTSSYHETVLPIGNIGISRRIGDRWWTYRVTIAPENSGITATSGGSLLFANISVEI